jgi:hypothetical protein
MIRGIASPFKFGLVSDPAEVAAAQARRADLEINLAWFREHAMEIYRQNRGKCICVAGQEVFVADTSPDAIAQATAAHPHDQGWFIRYIPLEKLPRIYHAH